jgi:hypothetical protein
MNILLDLYLIGGLPPFWGAASAVKSVKGCGQKELGCLKGIRCATGLGYPTQWPPLLTQRLQAMVALSFRMIISTHSGPQRRQLFRVCIQNGSSIVSKSLCQERAK